MTFIEQVPALIRLLIVFALVIVCVRKKLSLGNAFCFGAISMGLFFGLNPWEMGRSMILSVISPKTLALALIVSLILMLSKSMETTGQMERLLENFKGLIKHSRLNIVVFPALIGLLPMPGGAVFSAPMVKALGSSVDYSPAKLSFINYWFRHVWEYWWPLYPGILLITAIAEGTSLISLMMYQGPLTLFVLIVGNFYLTNQPLPQSSTPNDHTNKTAMPFFKELLPVIIVIVLGIGMGVMLSWKFPAWLLAKEIGLTIALILSLLLVWGSNRMLAMEIRKIVIDPQTLKMIYMIFSILIFKGMLEDSNAVAAITRELTYLKIPVVLIVAILPFLVGLITGITIAFVGSAFPILIPLIASLDAGSNIYPYLMLAMVCGFSGVLLSPVHLCLILSNQYFDVSMESVYKYLWKPCVYLIVAGFIYFYILQL
jgi:integral membrane protein (TIGR00529 family)